MDGGAGRRCDYADAPGVRRQRLFTGGVKQPLRPQLCLQLFKGDGKVAGTDRHQRIRHQLVLPAHRIHRHPPVQDDAHPVLRGEAQRRYLPGKHDAADRAVLILEREVQVTGGVQPDAGQLPLYINVAQRGGALQGRLDAFIQLTDRQSRSRILSVTFHRAALLSRNRTTARHYPAPPPARLPRTKERSRRHYPPRTQAPKSGIPTPPRLSGAGG